MPKLQQHTSDKTHPMDVPFYGPLLGKFPQNHVEPECQITSMRKLLLMSSVDFSALRTYEVE